ncbi:type II toxin-antitoxin system HipA family toxin [Nitratifractor sp.]
MIRILHHDLEVASFLQDGRDYSIVNHSERLSDSIALSLPNTRKVYSYHYRFPPFLETFLPEGYLYEVFKQILSKEYGEVDDYQVFRLLASNIEGRITFRSDMEGLDFGPVSIEEIVENDSKDTFERLLHSFLRKNAVSGIQPKTIALLRDKEKFETREHIVKTWGDEYPDLALNEYFCLRAVERAGLPIPRLRLSRNNRFLIVEKFTYTPEGYLGFEEVLSLMDKNRTRKYQGSYEQVAKVLYRFSTEKKEAMRHYFTLTVMNYLLRNGDAHLKNFGLLFHDDFGRIWPSPAYDVVNTVVYIHRDTPALTLEGKKIWWGRDRLVHFGMAHCLLSRKEAEAIYERCRSALRETMESLESYLSDHPQFMIGRRMLQSWEEALEGRDQKGVSDELVGTWRAD